MTPIKCLKNLRCNSEKGNDLTLNVDYTLQYLIQLGATPEKTVLGVPFYGRAYSLVNPAVNNIGAPAKKDISFKVGYHFNLNDRMIWCYGCYCQ